MSTSVFALHKQESKSTSIIAYTTSECNIMSDKGWTVYEAITLNRQKLVRQHGKEFEDLADTVSFINLT